MKPKNNQEVDIVVYPQYDYHHPVQQYNNLMSEKQNLDRLLSKGKITPDQWSSERNRLFKLQYRFGRKLAQDLITKYKGTKFDPTCDLSSTYNEFPKIIHENVVDEHTREDDTGVKD